MQTNVRHYIWCVEANIYFIQGTINILFYRSYSSFITIPIFCSWILHIRYFVFLMLVLLSCVIQCWCFYIVCTCGKSVFAFWCGRCQVQLPVYKFDFMFVLNETSNKGRPVGRSCSDRASCLWQDMFSRRPTPVEHTCYITACRTLHDTELRAELSSRVIRRNSILQALRQAVPSLLRKPGRCLCSWQRLRTFICDRLYRKRRKKTAPVVANVSVHKQGILHRFSCWQTWISVCQWVI